MPPEPPNEPPLGEGAREEAPLPEPPDGNPSAATAGIEAEVRPSDAVVSAPNPALDMLVARDAAAAATLEETRGKADPPLKTTPAQEWGAAIVLMIVFLFICAAAVSFFRG